MSLRSFRSSYHVPCSLPWQGSKLPFVKVGRMSTVHVSPALRLLWSCGLLGQNLRPAIDTVFDGSSTPVLQDNVLGVSSFTRAHAHTHTSFGPSAITVRARSELRATSSATSLKCARDRFCNQQLQGPKSR